MIKIIYDNKKEISIIGDNISYMRIDNLEGIQLNNYKNTEEIKELCEEIHFNLSKLELLLGE